MVLTRCNVSVVSLLNLSKAKSSTPVLFSRRATIGYAYNGQDPNTYCTAYISFESTQHFEDIVEGKQDAKAASRW